MISYARTSGEYMKCTDIQGLFEGKNNVRVDILM